MTCIYPDSVSFMPFTTKQPGLSKQNLFAPVSKNPGFSGMAIYRNVNKIIKLSLFSHLSYVSSLLGSLILWWGLSFSSKLSPRISKHISSY